MSALDDVDYGQVLDEVRDAMAPCLLDSNGMSLAGVTARFTGIMPLVHEIQRQLLLDLLKSFLTAVATITLILSLVHGSLAAGLVTMISNVFPILFMFGGLAWLEIPMDIGSVMTASVALGIAVDDTLHFLTFYRRGLARRDESPVRGHLRLSSLWSRNDPNHTCLWIRTVGFCIERLRADEPFCMHDVRHAHDGVVRRPDSATGALTRSAGECVYRKAAGR